MEGVAGCVEPFCRTPRQLDGPGIFHWLESRYARSRSYLAICSCFIDVAAFRYLRIDFSRIVFRNWTPALARRRYCGRAGRLELASFRLTSLCRSPQLRPTGTEPVVAWPQAAASLAAAWSAPAT